ncbi:hypothetical protein [Sphingomonas tagetis]|nr:hypothetical protein [Sphingomonas tagetis]
MSQISPVFRPLALATARRPRLSLFPNVFKPSADPLPVRGN